MSLKEPQLIDEYIDHFHVVEVIGHGAMASVYRAVDTELERNVALKIPNARYASNPDFVDRFLREARAMGKLQHRNIVQIYSVGKHNGALFLAMEYVDGVPLSRILAKNGRLEVGEAVDCIAQICEAIECAHGQGIVHRDIKPSNILVEFTGRILVADFGISKVMTGNTSEDTLTFIGTPIYMSPEQCGEGVLDWRTDIYSLGDIFYEMIVGKPPFGGETPAEIIKNHLMQAPEFPSGEGVSIPPRIAKVIRKMLSKNPEGRFLDTRAIIRELELWRNESRTERGSRDKIGPPDGKEPVVICYLPQKMLLGAMEAALKNIRHRMLTVENSTELMRKLETVTPNVVVISHQSGRNGVFRLAERIREAKNDSKIELIVLTHGISREEVETAFHSGINEIIAEPFDPSILISKLESILVGEQRSMESRRFFRKAISGKITVRIENEILDISEGGMRISTNLALKIGEVVRFESKLFRDLGFGEKTGKIAWVSKNDTDQKFSFQAGVDFIDMSRDERDQLRRWIFASEVTGGTRHSGIDHRTEPDMGSFLE